MIVKTRKYLGVLLSFTTASICFYLLRNNSQGISKFLLPSGQGKQPSSWGDLSSLVLDSVAFERQIARKELLRQFCKYNRTKSDFAYNISDGEALRVIPSLKILYCLTPKCASRQIRGLLYHSNWSFAPALYSFPPEEQATILNTHFKFTFVREPLERLLSAYKDKFVYPRQGDWHILSFHGQAILESFRPNATNRSLEKLDDITFPEFIQYLVTKGSNETTEVMDWHWDNYNNLCHMCKIDYDFIGHYETLGEDFSAFEEAVQMNFTKSSGYDNGLEVHPSNTSSELIKYYSKIPLHWIHKLGVIYKSSFEMFNYSFPGPLKRLF